MWLPTVQELPLGCAAFPKKTDAGLVGPGSFVENKTGSWATFQPKIDKAKCINCEFCWFYCPEGCISRSPEGLKIDKDYCKGCGICAEECPSEAITMVEGK
ncbi:MAG: 4Fe-4S binding protein [Thermoplasmata archaeon]